MTDQLAEIQNMDNVICVRFRRRHELFIVPGTKAPWQLRNFEDAFYKKLIRKEPLNHSPGLDFTQICIGNEKVTRLND